MNIGLLCKWWWKAENGEGIWQDIIRKEVFEKRDDWPSVQKSQEFPCVQ
jgi:hypothetical protein